MRKLRLTAIDAFFQQNAKKLETESMKTGKKYNSQLVEQKKLDFFIEQIPSEIDQFKELIKCKICKGKHKENFQINRIDFSYKIGKLKDLLNKL